eukprot:COSAG05_NODE_2795_length_2629_cov_3.130435_3_plen_123_part_00
MVSDVLARLHEHRVLAAGWRHRKREHLTPLEHPLHRGVERRRQLEVHVPAARPRAKGDRRAHDAVVRRLQQHPIQRGVHIRKLIRGGLVILLVGREALEAVALARRRLRAVDALLGGDRRIA